MTERSPLRCRLLPVFLLLGLIVALPGCVERKLTIKSDPAGADVIINGDREGKTPLDRSFTYYGHREIRLEKEGYRTKVENVAINPPFYEHFPLNFFAEVLYPFTLTDHHTVNISLEPSSPDQREEVMKRAGRLSEELSEKNNAGE